MQVELRADEFEKAKEGFLNYLRGLSNQDRVCYFAELSGYSPRTLSLAIKAGEETDFIYEFYQEQREWVADYLRKLPDDCPDFRIKTSGQFSPATMLKEIEEGTAVGRQFIFSMYPELSE